MLSTLLLLMSSTWVHADARSCTLHPKTFNPGFEEYPPHTKVTDDFNRDGENDFFYLAGQGDKAVTCLFFGRRVQNRPEMKLIHRDERHNTILDFARLNKPQMLIPQPLKSCGPAYGIDLIPAALHAEIKAKHAEWSKGVEAYAAKNSDPVASLYLLNPTHIYYYRGMDRLETTPGSTAYLELKAKVLKAVLEKKDLPPACAKELDHNLKRVERYFKEEI